MPTGKPSDTVPANECFTTELIVQKQEQEEKYLYPKNRKIVAILYR